MSANAKLIGGIWGLARRLWGDDADELLHAQIQQWFGKKHLRALTVPELVKIKDQLHLWLSPDGVTPRQQQRLYKFARKLWGDDWQRRLEGFILRQTGKNKLYALSKKEASSVLVGMKKAFGQDGG